MTALLITPYLFLSSILALSATSKGHIQNVSHIMSRSILTKLSNQMNKKTPNTRRLISNSFFSGQYGGRGILPTAAPTLPHVHTLVADNNDSWPIAKAGIPGKCISYHIFFFNLRREGKHTAIDKKSMKRQRWRYVCMYRICVCVFIHSYSSFKVTGGEVTLSPGLDILIHGFPYNVGSR